MSALANVTRWAHLLDRYAAEFKEDPRVLTPFGLAMIHKESRGEPDALNEPSNAVGLGQHFAWVDGQRWMGPPAVHPKGVHTGYRISWNPEDQTRAVVGVLHHHLMSTKRAGGHLPTAWLAYASGPGNVAKLVAGTAEAGNPTEKHTQNYLPALAQLHDVYSAWYAGWVAAGRPTYTASVESGDGKGYRVELAEHVAPASSPLRSPFDGTIRWNGRSIEVGPVGSDGDDPASLARAAASTTSNAALIVGGVLGGLAFGGLLLAALSGGGGS